jgi:exodeoxyribonuclease VII large subunit
MVGRSITLKELYSLIGETIHDTFDHSYWIKAEIAKLTENYSGHCYLELVEKSTENENIVAQGKAMIWSNIYRMLKAYFKTTTNRELAEGMKILFKARVEFHAVYGLSLNITDIDASYTIGDLALRKNLIIKKLKDEGVFDINRETMLSIVPQRIAVISSETAAGYNDFVTHLTENSAFYNFQITFFPAIMQGAKAEESIISALDSIYDSINKYDVVVIIRGGGSQTDLSCFDSYLLACHVAQFPIPIITGIGHEQDDSVTDMVAHTRLKTPTAVAEFLIDQFAAFEEKIDSYLQWTVDTCRDNINEQLISLERQLNQLPVCIKTIVHEEQNKVNNYMLLLNRGIDKTINKSKQEVFYHQSKTEAVINQVFFKHYFYLENVLKNMKTKSFAFIYQQNMLLEQYYNTANIANPENTLQRGFSIIKFKNKVITDSDTLLVGDEIDAIFYKGSVKSMVVRKQ